MRQTSQRSTTLLAGITIAISLLVSYFIAEFALGWYQRSIDHSSKQESGLMRYHPILGWTLSPSWQGRHQHHDFDVHYSTAANRQRNGSLPANSTGRRIALVGDSFTFGFGVNDEATFHARLNQLDPANRYFNLAVPGYSTDQQYLLIKQQDSQGYDQTLLMFYLGNDLLDNPLAYPLQASKAKPFFSLDKGQLRLHNQPVPRHSKPAALYSTTMNSIIFGDELQDEFGPLDKLVQSSRILSLLLPRTAATDPAHINALLQRRLVEQEQLLAALLSAIKTATVAANSPLTVALLPGQSYVVAPRSYSAYFQEYVRQRLLQMGQDLGIEIIDVAGQLRQRHHRKAQWFFPHEGHLTVAGHQQVAEILLSELNSGAH